MCAVSSEHHNFYEMEQNAIKCLAHSSVPQPQQQTTKEREIFPDYYLAKDEEKFLLCVCVCVCDDNIERDGK
jgi:hypothetical protein